MFSSLISREATFKVGNTVKCLLKEDNGMGLRVEMKVFIFAKVVTKSFRQNFRFRRTYHQKIMKKLYQNYFSPKMIVFVKVIAEIFLFAKIFVSRKFSHQFSFSQKFFAKPLIFL
jgi:hypothetical protein